MNYHRNMDALRRAEQMRIDPPEYPEPTEEQREVAINYLRDNVADTLDMELGNEYAANLREELEYAFDIDTDDLRNIVDMFLDLEPWQRGNPERHLSPERQKYAEAINAYALFRRSAANLAKAIGFTENKVDAQVDLVMEEDLKDAWQ